MTGTIALAGRLSESLRSSRTFQALAEERYGKPWLVESGFDRRRVEWTSACPFAVFAAGGASYPEGLPRATHDIGLVLGVNDRSFDRELLGYDFLGEKAWPAALDAIKEALRTMPGLYLGEYRLEFSQESYPLLYLNIAMSISETIPMGGRA